MKKITFISDTHGLHDRIQIDPCDILVHCGDATNLGRDDEVEKFFAWLSQQPADHFIFVPGNHDLCFEKDWHGSVDFAKDVFNREKDKSKLNVETKNFVEIEGINFFCYSYMKTFGNWAFMNSEFNLNDDLSRVPIDGIDVLVTHSPPFGMLDLNSHSTHCGTQAIDWFSTNSSPHIHAFGHIHESYGVFEGEYTTYINAAICSHFGVVKKPISVNVNKGGLIL